MDWVKVSQDALEQCAAFTAVCSDHYGASKFKRAQFSLARMRGKVGTLQLLPQVNLWIYLRKLAIMFLSFFPVLSCSETHLAMIDKQ